MALIRTKYATPSEPEAKVVQKIGGLSDQTLVPKLHEDGTLEVYNLKETSSDGISYELNEKAGKVEFNKDLDSNTKVQYIPKYVDKVYKTTVSFKEEVKEAFGVFKNDVKRFTVESMPRYLTSPKPLRKKIDAIRKQKKEYLFNETKGQQLWTQKFIDSTTFGPYNYDVQLHVTKDIDFINDLIVIRSGSYEDKYDYSAEKTARLPSNKWSIAWVSPHQTIVYSGVGIYTLTGTSFESYEVNTSGFLSGQQTFIRDYMVSNAGQCNALSSNHIRIPKGQYLNSGINYSVAYKDDDYGEEDDPQSDPLMQSFYYIYDEFGTGKYNTTGWDGVIPSGAWFNIETWSTNPKYVGFDGEITIKPTGSSDPTASYSEEVTGTASNTDYQQSIKSALKQAKKKFYKKLNKILIANGIKSKPARMAKYETLLERVAQNAYDGLSLVRNSQVGKVQGLESNPLNGPVYYDGTIQQYGGTQLSVDYNYSKTLEERYSSQTTGGTGSGS